MWQFLRLDYPENNCFCLKKTVTETTGSEGLPGPSRRYDLGFRCQELTEGVRDRGAAVWTPGDFRGHGEAALRLQRWPSARSALPPPGHPLFNGLSAQVRSTLCFLLCILNPLLGCAPRPARGKQLGKINSCKWEDPTAAEPPPWLNARPQGSRGDGWLGGGLAAAPALAMC